MSREILLPPEVIDCAYWDVKQKGWIVEPGSIGRCRLQTVCYAFRMVSHSRIEFLLALAALLSSACGSVRAPLGADAAAGHDGSELQDATTNDRGDIDRRPTPWDAASTEGLATVDGSVSPVDSSGTEVAPIVGPATCESPPAGRAVMLFRVPRVTDPPENTDFYRLPFPNDIRRRNGHISLQGHPRPGAGLLPFDLVARYIQAIEADSTGFGTNQAVYLRFSRDPDTKTLEREGALALIDISVGSPEYGQLKPMAWSANTGRTNYLCDRFMTIRPRLGQPLRPGTTYAAIVQKTVQDSVGNVFDQDEDFAAMLADQPPADADLAAAWTAYAPLRRYLGDANAPLKLTASELAVAVVYTTEDVEQPLAAIHAALATAPPPALSKFVRCGDPGAVSPCDDGKQGADHEHGCFPEQLADTSFDEYQGTVLLPVFQQGTAPYAQPQDGGGILLDASGKAAIVRSEPVCVSLAIPKGQAPAAGWPLVVYSHGTGGSYRSAITQGLAGQYAVGEATGGANVPMATLGYEGVLHGTRRGGSTSSPEELVYNFYNPRAARDNNLQAAADLLALPRAMAGWTVGDIKIDMSHIALYGHSQGGNAAALAAGRDSGYGAVVMSGTGGTLMLALLGKTSPINLSIMLPFLLSDAKVDENHPVLNLIQMYFERSDPVNFARRLFREPLANAQRRHVLHVYGTADTYAPNTTQRRYAQAAGFQVVQPLVDPYATSDEYGMVTVTSPVIANQAFGSLGLLTAAQTQYVPSGYDGHFVSTLNPSARTTIQKMLVTFVRDANPVIQM